MSGTDIHPLVRGPAYGVRISQARACPCRVREVPVAEYEGYCVKCREKRKFDGQVVELKNGRKAAQGLCPVCGTKMNRILGKDA